MEKGRSTAEGRLEEWCDGLRTCAGLYSEEMSKDSGAELMWKEEGFQAKAAMFGLE